MSDKIEAMLRQAITDARSAGDLPAFEVDELGVERPADSSNGDWTSTVALRSARLAHMSVTSLEAAGLVERSTMANGAANTFLVSLTHNGDAAAEDLLTRVHGIIVRRKPRTNA